MLCQCHKRLKNRYGLYVQYLNPKHKLLLIVVAMRGRRCKHCVLYAHFNLIQFDSFVDLVIRSLYHQKQLNV